ncbi:MAG TPA: OmpA family protein, partial [Nitrosopumilaceae archaeon]|nr:OmpA family protein [Nitrosopumilaceae archaeon]
LTETKHFDQDFFLNKIPSGDIVIEGIEYDLNKTTLRPESKKILDKIYDILKVNENLSIEINAHTDTRGSAEYNKKLSHGRAQSCVDYLISKGIAKERLLAQGFGEEKPLIGDEIIAGHATKEEMEISHQKNRRTTFKVIGESKINIINKGL